VFDLWNDIWLREIDVLNLRLLPMHNIWIGFVFESFWRSCLWFIQVWYVFGICEGSWVV